MLTVNVKFHGLVVDEYVEREEEYEVPSGTAVRAIMALFARRHMVSLKEDSISGHYEKLWETHVVMLNGIGLAPEKQLTTEVKEGDSIMIYFPVSGG